MAPENENGQVSVAQEQKPIDFDLEVKDGKIKLIVTHEGSDAGANLTISLNSDKLLDKLEKAIPGDWDKGVIAILKATLANVKI
jgi:hypothetical protein